MPDANTLMMFWFGGWVVFIWLWLAWKFARNEQKVRDEYEVWRKVRIIRFWNEPNVDLSYKRFCDETGRYYH